MIQQKEVIMSKHFRETMQIFDRIDKKLDLMIDLVDAQNKGDKKLEAEICKKLDELGLASK